MSIAPQLSESIVENSLLYYAIMLVSQLGRIQDHNWDSHNPG